MQSESIKLFKNFGLGAMFLNLRQIIYNNNPAFAAECVKNIPFRVS